MNKLAIAFLLLLVCCLATLTEKQRHKKHMSELQNHPVGELIYTWNGQKSNRFGHVCIHERIASTFSPVVNGQDSGNQSNSTSTAQGNSAASAQGLSKN